MRRAVLMMRQAISPRLAIRIVLNIGAPARKAQGLPRGAVSIGTTQARKQLRPEDGRRFCDEARQQSPASLSYINTCCRHAAPHKRALAFPAVDQELDAAGWSASRTHFDLPPGALKPKARAGDVAAVGRRPNRPREGRPGPWNSAEAGVARGHNPGDWLGRVGKGLGYGRVRRRKDAERKRGYEPCTFRQLETLPFGPQEARAVSDRLP